MKFPWEGNRCILCLAEAPLTKEHIIPDQVGGKLTACFLCKPCNDRLGRTVEAEVKKSPLIRLAIESLGPTIPKLANRIREGQTFIGTGEGGTVRGKMIDGVFRVNSCTKDDGSIIHPASGASKQFRHMLNKRGMSAQQVEEALQRFDAAPTNRLIPLGSGIATIKRNANKMEPALDGPRLSDQVLLKIAYEFVALHLGEIAYCDSEQLSALRRAVWEPSSALGAFSIDYLTTGKYTPEHVLKLEGRTPHAVVTIYLFGLLKYRVHFPQIALAPPCFWYGCHLDTGEEVVEVVKEQSSQIGEPATAETDPGQSSSTP
jgi:hypothetical protein